MNKLDGFVILMIFGVSLGIGIVMAVILKLLAVSVYKEQKSFIEQYQFDATLEKKLLIAYPHLSTEDMEKVAYGLKQFFMMNLIKDNLKDIGEKSIIMPSKLVDDLWHNFILDTKEYEKFCQKAFGKMLHHIPSEKISSSKEKNILATTYKTLHELGKTKLNKKWSSLPMIFDIDKTLNMKSGTDIGEYQLKVAYQEVYPSKVTLSKSKSKSSPSSDFGSNSNADTDVGFFAGLMSFSSGGDSSGDSGSSSSGCSSCGGGGD